MNAKPIGPGCFIDLDTGVLCYEGENYVPQAPPAGPRSVLEEAQSLIYGDRQSDYGPPTESFENIAMLWTAYLRGQLEIGSQSLTAIDVAHLMILLKISRNTTGGYKRDSAVDIAGYAGCIDRIEENR